MFGKKVETKEVKVVDETKINELRAEISQLKADHASEMRILNNEIKIKISDAVEEKGEKTKDLSQENAVLKKEVEILTKAFENMGFDVKDMKDILNKLVDGMISKNQIKVLK